jgi:hypothetical protein
MHRQRLWRIGSVRILTLACTRDRIYGIGLIRASGLVESVVAWLVRVVRPWIA